jgi:hypothetical protein
MGPQGKDLGGGKARMASWCLRNTLVSLGEPL